LKKYSDQYLLKLTNKKEKGVAVFLRAEDN
jgi:hypothetical protein